jgi:hypothetical protein
VTTTLEVREAEGEDVGVAVDDGETDGEDVGEPEPLFDLPAGA